MTKDFPVRGLLPKDETEAAAFLKKYPTYDGRGVVVAILDTGVDPAAAGLQVTSDGRPKMLDIIDCCGSGDVTLGDVVKPTPLESDPKVLTLTGVSGRQLRVNAKWTNPSGEYRLGMKRAYDLFPRNLVSRLTAERKEKFMASHQLLVSELQRKITAWKAKKGERTDEEQEVKADLDAQLEVLNDAAKNYDDHGAIYDCVVFNDGTTWRAVVDTNEDGDLSAYEPLADYALERKFIYFGEQAKLTYNVKFYDDGATLSIVTNAGAHGTHVAAITAACHPEDPDLNGVAPGAQIVSLKIGESRLGSMETGQGLSRAIKAILDTGCHLCNMSYGEDCGQANVGRWVELLRDELINKKQVVFVSSAGNAGPALSTVGAPGGTTSGVISVGAYATAEMIQAEYALLEQVPDTPHTWCSRGPTYDGHKGVTIYAPGAAITSVPQYLLQNSQLMNGTSMSSPNACGNIALLLSALKAENIAYTPYRIEKAIVNTGKDVKDPLMVGFLQIDQTHAYLKKYADSLDQDVYFDIKVAPRDSRGIYLRGKVDTSRVQQTNVNVSPTFRKDDVGQNGRKLAYEQRLTLVSSVPWVRVPEFLLLNSGGRDFSVKVDPTTLPAGFHYTEIRAYDTTCVEKGPVFYVPVSVTKATPLKDNKLVVAGTYFSGKIERQFVDVPAGASWAELTVKAKGARNPGRLVVHLLQMVPHLRHTKSEHHWYLTLNGDDPVPSKKFKVTAGVAMEVCTTLFWSSLGSYEIEFEVEFHGVQAGDELVCYGANGFKRIDVVAPLRMESFSPSVSFDTKRWTLRPANAAIKPLLSRDILPNKRVNCELLLTYDLKLKEGATVTLRKPELDDILYDSNFDSTLLMVHDMHKRVVAFGDIYAKAVKLEKGDYTVRLQLRHDNMELLEAFKTMPMYADLKLDSSVSLDVYSSLQDLQNPAKKSTSFKNGKIGLGEPRPFFIDCKFDKKGIKSGDILVGEMTYGNGKIEGGCVPATFVVAPEPNKESADSANGDDKEKPKLDEAVRDLKLDFLKKLTTPEEQKAVVDELVRAFPAHLPTLVQVLEVKVAALKTTDERVKAKDAILAAAKAVIDSADEQDVLGFTATKAPAVEGKEYAKKKKDVGDRKKALAQAYYRQAETLMLVLRSKPDAADADVVKAFEASWAKFSTFGDVADLRGLYLLVARETFSKRYGTALKAVNKWLADNGLTSPGSPPPFPSSTFLPPSIADLAGAPDAKKVQLLRADLIRQLGWSAWQSYEESWVVLRFPNEFAQF